LTTYKEYGKKSFVLKIQVIQVLTSLSWFSEVRTRN